MESINNWKDKAISTGKKGAQAIKDNVLTEKNKNAVAEFFVDLKDSMVNVIKGIRLPNRKGLVSFVLHQLIATAAGWTAGTLASDLVGRNFKVKGFNNLWGLKGKKDGRTMVSKEDFELYNWWARFLIGLIIMIVVRYLVMQTIEEFEKIRARKKQEKENA